MNDIYLHIFSFLERRQLLKLLYINKTFYFLIFHELKTRIVQRQPDREDIDLIPVRDLILSDRLFFIEDGKIKEEIKIKNVVCAGVLKIVGRKNIYYLLDSDRILHYDGNKIRMDEIKN